MIPRYVPQCKRALGTLAAIAALAASPLTVVPAHAANLVVGQIAPFSGPLAPTGEHMRAGAQLYFDHVNANGGVHGEKITLVSRDDGYRVDETLRLTRELLAEHAPIALFGIVGTGNIEALAEAGVFDAQGVPGVGMRTGATSLIEPPRPNLFLGRASYATEVDSVLTQLLALGMQRIGVFYQDDPFGADGLQAATAVLARHGLTPVISGTYEKNTTKVEAAAQAMAKLDPQGILMVANTAASAAFIKQFREQGGTSMLMVLSTADGPQIARSIGQETAHGVTISQIVPSPSNRSVALVREFQQIYNAAAPAGIEPNYTLLQGYVGARILVEGLRRAGPNPTRERLRGALENLRNLDLGGLTIDFGPDNRAGLDYVEMTVINRDGHLRH